MQKKLYLCKLYTEYKLITKMATVVKQKYSAPPSMTVVEIKGDSVLCASTNQMTWYFMLEGTDANGSLLDGGAL